MTSILLLVFLLLLNIGVLIYWNKQIARHLRAHDQHLDAHSKHLEGHDRLLGLTPVEEKT